MHPANAARRALLVLVACAASLLPSAVGMTPARAAGSGSTSATTSASPTPPAKVTPTDKTDNSPALVLGGAAGSLVLIGLIAAFTRSRLKDDE